MNQFTLLVIILVVFTYYGGSNVPKVLKDNKELLLGVVGGLVLCSFLGMRLEGLTVRMEHDGNKISWDSEQASTVRACKAAHSTVPGWDKKCENAFAEATGAGAKPSPNPKKSN